MIKCKFRKKELFNFWRVSFSGTKNICFSNQHIVLFTDEYPDFCPHKDDTNNLSTTDYIYVYSLLLHFCCVKKPNVDFHKKCESLDQRHQQVISDFLNSPQLQNNLYDKSSLRQAIGVFKNPITPKILRQKALESICSPLKTPTRTLRISPSTPKSSLLEEKTKEMAHLRAQLDTEKYENGLLEVQIQQNEQKIQKLTKDYKKQSIEMQELKNQLLAKDTENCSPNKKDIRDEQVGFCPHFYFCLSFVCTFFGNLRLPCNNFLNP